jgi:hypothetical protein
MRLNWLLPVLVIPLAARAQTTVKTATALRADPDGRLLATLRPGTPVSPVTTKGSWTRIALEGYLHKSVVGGKRDTFAISAGEDGTHLRATASLTGKILASLEEGMGLTRVSGHGDWIRVRRLAWVRSSALERPSEPPRVAARSKAKAAPSAPAKARPSATANPADAADTTTVAEANGEADTTSSPANAPLSVERRTELRLSPEGTAVAALDSNARVTTLARERGWVRVRVEGWVRATDLVPADTSVLTAVSAADLRAEPDKFRGQTVRWQVQKIALLTADPLRRGMAPDEPYLLARGPGNESSLLYLALPPSLVDQARRIDPLATLIVTARVRSGRSEPSGVPLLDVESLVQR